jgi:hypothetical protein
VNEPTSRPNAADHQFRRLLPFEIGAWVLALFSSALIGILRPDGWRMDLFIWGLFLGVVGVAHNEFMFRVGPRLAGATGSELAAVRARGKLRRRVYTIGYIVFGVFVGTYSAATGDMWFEVGFTILAGVIWFGVLIAIPLLARRIRARQAASRPSSEQD